MRTVLLSCILLFYGCRPATQEPPLEPVSLPTLDGLVDAAQEQIRQQYARTQSASRSSENRGAAYGKLGQLLFTYDFLDAAGAAFRNAQSLDPGDEQWTYYLGMLYRQQGRFEDAAAQFEQIAARRPDDVLARVRLAETYLELRHPGEARSLLEDVTAAAPRNAFAHVLLGQIAIEAEEYANAVEHYQAALTLQPNATQVHAPLGLAYRNLGDMEKSEYHLARRGRQLVQLNDPRVRALEAFKESTGATAITQGEALLNAGRYDEAVALLERAVAQDSTQSATFLNLGVAYSYAGHQDMAIEAFEQAIRLDPSKSEAHYNLGAIFAANGRLDVAEKRFREAIASDPRYGVAHMALASLLRRSGRCEEALPHYERALEAQPGDITARQHQSLCHLVLGDFAAARALLEAGLAASPNHLGYIDALARVLATDPEADAGDRERALSLAEQAVALQRRAETLETLAMAYARSDRYEEAVAHQNEAIRMVEQRGNAPYLAHLRDNLRRYEQETPSLTPWPPFMYEQ